MRQGLFIARCARAIHIVSHRRQVRHVWRPASSMQPGVELKALAGLNALITLPFAGGGVVCVSVTCKGVVQLRHYTMREGTPRTSLGKRSKNSATICLAVTQVKACPCAQSRMKASNGSSPPAWSRR